MGDTTRSLIGTVMGLWFLSVILCILALRWTLMTPRRFWPSVILSAVALAGGCLGMTHFRIVASRTVNGHMQWKFDSRHFFIVTMVLAAVTLVLALWKEIKSRRAPAPT